MSPDHVWGYWWLCKMSISYSGVFLACVGVKAPGSQNEVDAATISPSHSGKGLQFEILEMINCSVGNTPFPCTQVHLVMLWVCPLSIPRKTPYDSLNESLGQNVEHQNNRGFFFPGCEKGTLLRINKFVCRFPARE